MRKALLASALLAAALFAPACSSGSPDSTSSNGEDALSQDTTNSVITRLGKLTEGATLAEESDVPLANALAKLDGSLAPGELERWLASYGNPESAGVGATKVTKNGRDYQLVSRRWLTKTDQNAVWLSIGYAEDENGGFAFGETHKLDFSTGELNDDFQFFVTDKDAAIRKSGQPQKVALDEATHPAATAALHVLSGPTGVSNKPFGNGFACTACTTALWALSKGSVAVAAAGIGMAGFEVANTFCAHVAAVVGAGTAAVGAVPAFGICEAAFVAGAIAVYLVGRSVPSDTVGQENWCNNHFHGICSAKGPAACAISAITTGPDGKSDLNPEHVCERVVPCAKLSPCNAVPALCSGVILNGDQKLVDTCTQIAMHACISDTNTSLNSPQDAALACAQIVSKK